MAISFSQLYDIVCPACGQPFNHDTWVIVDAGERPDLAAAVSDLTLHDAHCPHCGQLGVIDAPVLYHDYARRQVLFGVPRNLPEAEWRELAQGLLWMLIGALPPEQQLPYLGDVQAEDGLAGVAQALELAPAFPQTAAEAIGDAVGAEGDELPVLAEAVMTLLEAENVTDLRRVIQTYPFLLDAAMDEGLQQLADAAIEQREYEVGQAFERARISLHQLRETIDDTGANWTTPASAEPVESPLPEPPAGWRDAVRGLLALNDSADLPALLKRYPVLRDQYADAWLHDHETAVHDAGDLAQAQLVSEARAMLRGER